ncbi:hypothetical protein KI387_009151, partial [Taxus chinensis]
AFVHVDKENRKKLDVKSKRCTFIGYGSGDFGFRFWDLKNSKIIRSHDVEWNEKRMYRDQILVPKDEPVEKFVNENELSDLKVIPTGLHSNRCQLTPDQHWLVELVSVTEEPNRHRLAELMLVTGDRHRSLTNLDTNVQEVQNEPLVPQTPVRRSQRVSKPPKIFTPLFYLLLIDNGEPESFEEAMQDKTHVQWEHGMDEEMNSLEQNQTWDLVKLPA